MYRVYVLIVETDKDVGRDLKCDVCRKEDRDADLVLVPLETEIFLEVEDSCIAWFPRMYC